MSDIKTEVRNFISESILMGGGKDIADDTSFHREAIIDSTGVLELVAFLETRFEIAIADEELHPRNLDSLNSIAAFVGGKLARRAPV